MATDARAVFYAMLTALEGGRRAGSAQHDVEALLAAGRAVSAHVATLPVAAHASG